MDDEYKGHSGPRTITCDCPGCRIGVTDHGQIEICDKCTYPWPCELVEAYRAGADAERARIAEALRGPGMSYGEFAIADLIAGGEL